MTRLLVSVRSVAEARLALDGGADLIDLKEPSRGALGGLELPTIAAIVDALGPAPRRATLSATVGDHDPADSAPLLARVRQVTARGVDLVKVGIPRHEASPALLRALAASGIAVVPVFIADEGLDPELIAQASGLGFAGWMVDTADKAAGSLLQRVPHDAVQGFLDQARAAGVMAGLAGALRLEDVSNLRRLAPDFAGFRSAVCQGGRSGTLDAARLRALREALAEADQAALLRASPSSSERTRASSAW